MLKGTKHRPESIELLRQSLKNRPRKQMPYPHSGTVPVLIGSKHWETSKEWFFEQGRPLENAMGCWEWQGIITPDGYAKFYTGLGRGHTATSAHRISYCLFVGPVPDGLVVDHLCNNSKCVNPAHLSATTQSHNIGRAMRQAVCAKGHYLTDDNLYRHGKLRKRVCRRCEQIRCLAYYHRHKEARRATA